MSTAAQLLAEVARLGIQLQPRGDALAFRPRRKVNAALQAQLEHHKADILRLLRGEPIHGVTEAIGLDLPRAEVSVLIPEPQPATIEAVLLSVLSQRPRPREVLVRGRRDRKLRKCLARFRERGIQEVPDLSECSGRFVLLLGPETLLPADWLRTALPVIDEHRVGAVYSDHELLGSGERTNYPEHVDAADLARSGLRVPTVLMRQEAWQAAGSELSAAELLRNLAHTGWRLRKHQTPVLWRGGTEQSYFQRQELARETITLFIPLAGREHLWREMRRFLERQTWPHDQLRLILCDTSQDPRFGRRLREWIARCDYPDVRHLKFALHAAGLADAPRDEQLLAVNQVMCRIYNRLRESISTDYVWILEDDIIPPRDVVARLFAAFDEHVASVSAPYRSRFDGKYLVWSRERAGPRGGLVNNGVHQLPRPLPDPPQAASSDCGRKSGDRRREKNQAGSALAPDSSLRTPDFVRPRRTEVQEIRGSGFGCLLLRAEVLREHIFCLPPGEVCFDVRFFRELDSRWKRRVDWSCECRHLHNVPRPQGRITTRNLLYHITPFASNDIWLRNVRQLLKRIDLFNGRRVVAIATGEGLVPPEEVKNAFGRHEVEILTRPNSAHLRENATFLPLLDRIADPDPHVATFYAHAKGVAKDVLCSGDPLGSRYWRNAMYRELLDDWPRIAELLDDYAVVGTHRFQHNENMRIFPDGRSESRWHFKGTFFWFRNADTFSSTRWRDVWQPTGWGTEAWPGRMFEFEQSACVAYEGIEDHYNPDSYDPQIEDAP